MRLLDICGYYLPWPWEYRRIKNYQIRRAKIGRQVIMGGLFRASESTETPYEIGGFCAVSEFPGFHSHMLHLMEDLP